MYDAVAVTKIYIHRSTRASKWSSHSSWDGSPHNENNANFAAIADLGARYASANTVWQVTKTLPTTPPKTDTGYRHACRTIIFNSKSYKPSFCEDKLFGRWFVCNRKWGRCPAFADSLTCSPNSLDEENSRKQTNHVLICRSNPWTLLSTDISQWSVSD